ncbi:plasmid stabilization protein [Xenorhabdus nematophila]|nr:conserved hypothetical protein [Xenorhabdus nematophila AN6/1]
MNKYRNASLKPAFTLTEDGKERAGEIYHKRLDDERE